MAQWPDALARLEREGLGYHTLDNIRRGRRPHAETLKALCRALGVSADWLLGLTDQRSPGHSAWRVTMEHAVMAVLDAYARAHPDPLETRDFVGIAQAVTYVFDAAWRFGSEDRRAIDQSAATIIPFVLARRTGKTTDPDGPGARDLPPAGSAG